MINYPVLLCYTRIPQDDMIYSSHLAFSMHLALSYDGINYTSLNHNSGVLFSKATQNEDGTLNAKTLRSPFVFKMKDKGYGILAIRTDSDGEDDPQSKGKVLFFKTYDFLSYSERGLIKLGDAYITALSCDYDADDHCYNIYYSTSSGDYKATSHDLDNLKTIDSIEKLTSLVCSETISQMNIEGVIPGNQIAIEEDIAERLFKKLVLPRHISNSLPDSISVSSAEKVKEIKVTCHYSDGTKADKKVDWNTTAIDWTQNGLIEIKGTIHQDHYEFPFAINRADPFIGKWNGKYYFIATNDADGNHTLYIREADNIPSLVYAEEKLILDSNTYDHVKGLLWAPEFHIIKDKLYIFHACNRDGFFFEESHVMRLKENGNPVNKEDWEAPRRVVKKDGSYLCEAGKTISLDMTVIRWDSDYYAVWSQRQFLPVDQGAWLYIAKIDPDEPWKLVSNPTLLSIPEYGWENNHTFVDEGPYALYGKDRLFLTFAAAAVDATYVESVIVIDYGKDILNPKSWVKSNYPLLTSRNVPGEFGPGHSSFVTDDDGLIWFVYHARPGVDGPRSSGIRRAHFDIDGYPVLDMIEEMDLNPGLKEVILKVKVI